MTVTVWRMVGDERYLHMRRRGGSAEQSSWNIEIYRNKYELKNQVTFNFPDLSMNFVLATIKSIYSTSEIIRRSDNNLCKNLHKLFQLSAKKIIQASGLKMVEIIAVMKN